MVPSALTKCWYYALAIGSIAGTIIGVGMFGLPYVAKQAGFFVTAGYLIFFGIIVGLAHLLYAEITLRTKENHRFTGYVGYYFGTRWKTITLIQGLISLWGTLLIYTIVGSEFVVLVFPDILHFLSLLQVGIIFFALCSYIVWRGDNSVGNQELLFTIPMAAIIIIIFFKAVNAPNFSAQYLLTNDWSQWISPYGVTLFALFGFSIIPILEHILAPALTKGLRFNYPFIVMTGTLLPALLYILFTFAVLGVNGVSAKQAAPLAGLIEPLGFPIIAIGAVLGIFAIYTSFIAVGNELQKTFFEDYHLKKGLSFFGAMTAPFLLYLANIQDFIAVADFVGAIMGGYMGVMIILLFWKAQRHSTSTPPFSVHLPKSLGWFIMTVFTFSSLYALGTIVMSFIHTPFSN